MRCKQEVKPEKKPEAKSGKPPSKKAKREEISQPKPQQTRRKRVRTKKAIETEQATRDLVHELDDSYSTLEPKSQTRRKRVRTKKATETEQATRGLLRELDESDNTPRYHITLETPVSEHGADVMLRTPSQTPLLINIRPLTAEDSTAMTTPVSDSGDFPPEVEFVVDQYVREGENSEVEELAEAEAELAAKGLENLDNSDGKLVFTAFYSCLYY